MTIKINLNTHLCLIFVGVSDLGGISPIDEVNPDYPFMDVKELQKELGNDFYHLTRRLPVHDAMIHKYFSHTMGRNKDRSDNDSDSDDRRMYSPILLSVLADKSTAATTTASHSR